MVTSVTRSSAGTERSDGRGLADGNALADLNEMFPDEMFPDEMFRVGDALCGLYSAINSEAESKGIGCIAGMARFVREFQAASV